MPQGGCEAFVRIELVRHRSRATPSRQPRQVRKEATVTGSCVCSGSPVPGFLRHCSAFAVKALTAEIGAENAEKRLQYLANKVNRKHTALAIVAAVLVGFPAGWTFAMARTPVLWRLEPVLHMELAGHSGPSDWIFYIAWALLIPGLFFFFQRRFARSPNKR